MIVKTNELKERLQYAVKIVANKEYDFQQTKILFFENSIYAYNDDMLIRCNSPVSIGTCAVPGKQLFALISKINKNEISLAIEDKNLVIATKHSKTTIKADIHKTMPIDNIEVSHKYLTSVPYDFKVALELVSVACGTNLAQPLSTCVRIHDNIVEACATTQAARYVFETKLINKNIFLPRTTCEKLCLLPIDAIGICENGWAIFTIKHIGEVYCRTYYEDQKFPNILPLLEENGDELMFPERLPQIIDRAEIVLDNEKDDNESHSKLINISISDRKIGIKTDGSLGQYSEETGIDFDKNVSFCIPVVTLREILNHGRKCSVCSKFIKRVNGPFSYITAISYLEETYEI